jgi:hypothetical protein
MPIPEPATPEEEEEQLAEAFARSLVLEPAAASAGTVRGTAQAAAGAAVSQAREEPEPEDSEAAQDAPVAPQNDVFAAVPRQAIASLPSRVLRFYVCWRLPLHPAVCGVVACAEPGAWPRFARVCLGTAGAAGSGADFCGGRRTPTLAEAERVFLSRWRRTEQARPLQHHLLV